MNSRDLYAASYRHNNVNNNDRNHIVSTIDTQDFIDNVAEFNANHFKLYDDFTTDLRIVNFTQLRTQLYQSGLAVTDAIGRGSSNSSLINANNSNGDIENGNPLFEAITSNDCDLLENEVMVDTWSSMESTNSPLTDSGPSASDDYTPSTSSGLRDPTGCLMTSEACCIPDSTTNSPRTLPNRGRDNTRVTDKPRSRDLALDLQTLDNFPTSSRRHFLDDDYHSPTKSNLECRIPKPHFLDHSPSPDEFDERSDITNPNFLDDDVIEEVTKSVPKKPQKTLTTNIASPEDRPHRNNYRIGLHYGLESAARSNERDKRASQLYQRTWPGEREPWPGHDTASVRSFSSNGSSEVPRPSSNLENKMECVYSLLSLLTLSPDNNADLSGSLLEMSRSVDSCIAMRQAGCIPLLVQLIHSKLSRETRDRAAKALRNIIHTQTDDKAGRREARVWRLLEQVREYCYILEDLVESRKEGKDGVEDDASKHPSQCVAALMKLSFDEEHRHVVCHLGGLQALAALVSGDQAAHGSNTDDSTCLTMRRYAGMTLTNLTFGDGNNKTLLCSFKDFMMALVEQLESPNDDMRQVTAAVLRNLSWRADTNSKQILREVGAVKGLTKAAMTCQKEATLKSVLSALWNLTAHCSMNKVALCSVDGALGFLVDMLSYNSPTKTLAIVENAGGIMRNVSSHIAVREDYRQILRERNCLSVLLQHLKSPSLTVVSNSCGTLWNLSARCPTDQQFLWDHGAVPMLRSLIHSKHKMIAMGSSAALKNLLNSKPGRSHIVSLDSTARNMNLPALPTLGARKQKALEQELDQNLAETCDNIEPATSPTTSHRDEKNLFTATERQIAMNLERHRMTSSSPLVGALTSQISLSHSANLAGFLSCTNTLLKGTIVTRSVTNEVNRSDSKDSVASTHSDPVFDRTSRLSGKVPVPTPRNKEFVKADPSAEVFKAPSEPKSEKLQYIEPPVPTPRVNYTESGFDVDQDSCDQPIDYSRKYSETKPSPGPAAAEAVPQKKEGSSDYQETDLDQPTDYSLRYAEHQTEAPSVDEDTIKHFCTEGTPYETPVIFSTATSMSDLRVIGQKEAKKRVNVKETVEVVSERKVPVKEKRGSVFDTKLSSGMISPEKPVNYCEEGTPGYFSRVSSLSSLGEPTPAATIEPPIADSANLIKNKEASKAVTFASAEAEQVDPNASDFVQDTPLMFSRTSSLDSIPECDDQDEHISVESEHSRMTSCCISPSELPDSPGAPPLSGPASPPPRPLPRAEGLSPSPATPAEPTPEMGTVFEERVSQFIVENTPAHFSTATSLSELTIPDDKSVHEQDMVEDEVSSDVHPPYNTLHLEQSNDLMNDIVSDSADNEEITKDVDTCHVYITEDTPALSDISVPSNRLQMPMHSEHNTSNPYQPYDGVYHSLPPYLRSSTETVKMSHEVARHVPTEACGPSPPPPLPPKCSTTVAPPRPPALAAGKKRESRLPVKAQRCSKSLTRNDSLSSLSLDSFGSTDREIFEQTVKAGVSTARATTRHDTDARAHPAHTHARLHKSLDRADRADRLATHRDDRHRQSDRHRHRRTDTHTDVGLTRSPHSYPGDAPGHSLAGRRHHHRAERERSDSPSSLSNDSFGSTDKEVFERCVRLGMSNPKKCDVEAATVERAPRPRRRRDPANPAPARPAPGALDRMLGDKYSRDRAILEEVIAKGAGEKPPTSKNVPAPFAVRASVDGNANNAPPTDTTTGCESDRPTDVTVTGSDSIRPTDIIIITGSEPNRLSVGDSPNAALDCSEVTDMDRSNECLAPRSDNTTLLSESRGELDRSNESYADVPDGSLSDPDRPPENDTGTLKRKPHEWTDINIDGLPDFEDVSSKRSHDTWSDTCPDDVTFPTMSGSVLLATSIRSEPADLTEVGEMGVLPDLLDTGGAGLATAGQTGPDLTTRAPHCLLIDSVPEPSFTSLLDDDAKYASLMSTAIQKEATRLAAQLDTSHLAMESSAASATSLDLDNVRPPADLGSLLSLSGSGNFDEPRSQTSKMSQRRKKSLPVSLMVKRALNASMHRSGSELADQISLLENVKPPSEMESVDLESSMLSVCSIVSEVADPGNKTPVVFDLKQPIQDFPLCNNFIFQDLENVNPPSLFEEIGESTAELDQSTVHPTSGERVSATLHDVPVPVPDGRSVGSGSESCTPLPSDVSSVDSTPKRNCLTPKQRRQATKDRYQTYTITDSVSENTQMVLEIDHEEFLTWTKSESDSKSDDYVTAASEPKIKRKLSAKQRRQEDRARYQTQTVDIGCIVPPEEPRPDPRLETLKRRLASKKTIKQKRTEDADRYKTRTLSDEISSSPTFVSKDANFENVETTTGYDSFSSNEPIAAATGERNGDVDSGHNEDDFELNSVRMQTYTKSFRNYLPVVESPSAVDLCVVNNLKNIEMTATYRNNTNTSDFASLDGDDDGCRSDSDSETRVLKPKPKIIKPEERRDESLDSNESLDKEPAKGIRGRKKASYVSPYRRNVPKSISPQNKTAQQPSKPLNRPKATAPTRTPTKPAAGGKLNSTNTSPKRTAPNSPATNTVTKSVAVPLSGAKPLPLERQGTFTKESPAKTPTTRVTKTAKTSPSRLPQPNTTRFAGKPPPKKANGGEKPSPKKAARAISGMKSSASNHSLQSNESGNTVTLGRRSRHGSAASVASLNTVASANTREVESKIASLWRKVEQTKRQAGPDKPDRRVWIEGARGEDVPRLVRSTTFEARPKASDPAPPTKQKSQIPSLRPKSIPPPKVSPNPAVSRKPVAARMLAKKHTNGQTT